MTKGIFPDWPEKRMVIRKNVLSSGLRLFMDAPVRDIDLSVLKQTGPGQTDLLFDLIILPVFLLIPDRSNQ